jgi:hypothetical protein
VGRKCRAEYVKVLVMYGDGNPTRATNKTHSKRITYEVGKIVRADEWDDDIRVECAHGIHFFITRKEAEEW